MRRLDLTAEDMADLIAGNSINAMVEGGEEIIVAAPDGVNREWVPPTAEEVAEAYAWADRIIAKIPPEQRDERDVANAESNRRLAERKELDDMPMRPTGPRGCNDCGAPPYSYHAGICEEE